MEGEPLNILYWLRSDLRLHDNPALRRFGQASAGLVLWCPSRSQKRAGDFRRSFLWASLGAIAADMRSLGATVRIEDKDIREVLPELLRSQVFDLILFSEEPCTEERQDEAWVRSLDVPCESFSSRSLLHETNLNFSVKDIPEVFTHFRKKVEADLRIEQVLPTPDRLPGSQVPTPETGLSLNSIADRVTHAHPKIRGGETLGLARLTEDIWDLDRLRFYKETRDGLLNWNDSSKLSPWLAAGALSPRLVYAEIKRYEAERVQNQSTYWLFFELLWRDYFHWISLKWGSRLFTGMKACRLSEDENRSFESWKKGQTGQEFIDAHMRELRETGWMSNRGRQNVANFLVKPLGVDWRLGAAYFEEQLIDYDPCSNWGNWAYQAGVGQDPRNRRFDPLQQATLYDPDGVYQRIWNAKDG